MYCTIPINNTPILLLFSPILRILHSLLTFETSPSYSAPTQPSPTPIVISPSLLQQTQPLLWQILNHDNFLYRTVYLVTLPQHKSDKVRELRFDAVQLLLLVALNVPCNYIPAFLKHQPFQALVHLLNHRFFLTRDTDGDDYEEEEEEGEARNTYEERSPLPKLEPNDLAIQQNFLTVLDRLCWGSAFTAPQRRKKWVTETQPKLLRKCQGAAGYESSLEMDDDEGILTDGTESNSQRRARERLEEGERLYNQWDGNNTVYEFSKQGGFTALKRFIHNTSAPHLADAAKKTYADYIRKHDVETDDEEETRADIPVPLGRRAGNVGYNAVL